MERSQISTTEKSLCLTNISSVLQAIAEFFMFINEILKDLMIRKEKKKVNSVMLII